MQNNLPVDGQRLREFTRTLQKYKAGKASIERRCIAAENWWKLRNSAEEAKEAQSLSGFKAVSGWLHNVLVSKHADGMDAYPQPNILPREPGDAAEARKLSKILPVVLEQNAFEEVYSDVLWQKLKTGTGVFKVVWDRDKLGGLGDISIQRVDLLNIFWEPGVGDIQQSAYVFCTSLEDTGLLEQQYPQLKGKLGGNGFSPSRFQGDDAAYPEGRTLVIEVYYKKRQAGRSVLHYCRYVGETVLYSTENEEAEQGRTDCHDQSADWSRNDNVSVHSKICHCEERSDVAIRIPGLYNHGQYPFVFDCLFPVEGSPCGYGFIDLCRNPQTQIDLLQTAFIRNTMVGAVPRYFRRIDGAINDSEFLDINRALVTVDGNLGEDSLRAIDYRPLSGNYLEVRQNVIEELRETSGNTETSSGVTSGGVTAASAIAALQEASGKGSRDASRTSYRAYGKVIELCIELIRQFYTLPRQFRITGAMGDESFVSYSNEALLPRSLGTVAGVELGHYQPVFDVKVVPERQSPYKRLEQNELALQFYQLGFFQPERAQAALGCLEMMEFEGKEELCRRIRENALRQQRFALMAQAARPMTAPDMRQSGAIKAASAAIPGGEAQ